MPSQWSLQDAKNKFSAVVEAACQGSPQFVTRRGKPAVVVVSAEEYEKMRRQERLNALDFATFLLSMPSADQDQTDDRQSSGLSLREIDF